MTYQNNEAYLNIAMVGTDEQTRMILKKSLYDYGKRQYALVDSVQSADVIIFDLDSLEAMDLWKEYRALYPSLPILILSLHYRSISGTFFIQKPINVEKLLKILEKIKIQKKGIQIDTESQSHPYAAETKVNRVKLAAEIQREKEDNLFYQFCGYAADIDPYQPQAVEKIYYDHTHYLQGFLEKAFTTAQQSHAEGILIEGLHTPMILLPEKNQLLCSSLCLEEQLHTMAVLPLSASSHLRLLSLDEATIEQWRLTEKLFAQPLEPFLWKVALWTARGHLPKGTSLFKNVVLKQWPNFTRLIITPHALEIAALWIAQPHSLIETAKVLSIAQRYVFAFFSATQALKLTVLDHQQEKRAYTLTALPHAKRSLFQQLLAHLRSYRN